MNDKRDIEKACSMTDFDGIENGSFEAFCQLMHVLRSDIGCPWDKEQTFDSLKSSVAGEMAEVMAGISIYQKTGDASNFCEELGDLFMNLIMLMDMAEEKGLFDRKDVMREAGRKMIRRHPHVFGEEARKGWTPAQQEELKELPATWKEIKAVEKAGRTKEQEMLAGETLKEATAEIIRILEPLQFTS